MARKSRNSDPNFVVIKRYGNRRLYNTETSGYVTLTDLIELIRAGRNIQVLDSATKQDVTKLILTQIILEEEKNKKNLLPETFLYQLIRAQQDSGRLFSKLSGRELRGLPQNPTGVRTVVSAASWSGRRRAAMWERLFPGAEGDARLREQGQTGRPPSHKEKRN